MKPESPKFYQFNWRGEGDVLVPNLGTMEVYDGQNDPLIGTRVAVARGQVELSTKLIEQCFQKGVGMRQIAVEIKNGIKRWSRGVERR